jgi:hypothetical protein
MDGTDKRSLRVGAGRIELSGSVRPAMPGYKNMKQWGSLIIWYPQATNGYPSCFYTLMARPLNYYPFNDVVVSL